MAWEDQLIVQTCDLFLLCVSLTISLFPDLFFLFSRVEDFAFDLPFLELLLLLAFVFLLPLL